MMAEEGDVPRQHITRTQPAVPPDRAPDGDKRNRAYLIVLAGVSAGEMFQVKGEKTTIGRGPKVNLRLNDEGVSREHCQITFEGTQVTLQDLGSTNGTFCNGVRVDRRELSDGDKIMVGSTTILRFTYHDHLDEVFQRQMYESALRDGLTKVFNRKYFTDCLDKEFAYATRHNTPLALIFVDIDHFRKINETFGHAGGDFVLSELSVMLAMLVRTEDILARFGGEEFTVLCRGTDLPGALVVAERLRTTIQERTFTFNGRNIPVTISAGVSAIPDPAIRDDAAFLAAADKAMYEAKRAGRNRVSVRRDENTPGPVAK
ncbi:MAG TPA: GGDEF domain-containing protein [Polyangia bacterium]|nr:GGDEF domain-containing protein [Polyangia bacterium]